MSNNDCAVTIFGRPLGDMTLANANAARSYLAELDMCPECMAYRKHFAVILLDSAVPYMCVNSACAGRERTNAPGD